jgi:hypothetical protein
MTKKEAKYKASASAWAEIKGVSEASIDAMLLQARGSVAKQPKY